MLTYFLFKATRVGAHPLTRGCCCDSSDLYDTCLQAFVLTGSVEAEVLLAGAYLSVLAFHNLYFVHFFYFESLPKRINQ